MIFFFNKQLDIDPLYYHLKLPEYVNTNKKLLNFHYFY